MRGDASVGVGMVISLAPIVSTTGGKTSMGQGLTAMILYEVMKQSRRAKLDLAAGQ